MTASDARSNSPTAGTRPHLATTAGTRPHLATADQRFIFKLGAVCAGIAVAAMLFDIVLGMVPAWGTSSVPTTAAAWLEQMARNPWLGLRNLDLLNVGISLISLPLYVALYAALRRRAQATSLLALLVVTLGTAVFAANNVALPMLELGREYGVATTLTARQAMLPAASVLLARGAHGTLGAFPGFFLSAVGTLLVTVAMLGDRTFARRVAWLGVLGASAITAYVLAVALLPMPPALIMVAAAPGGLLMLAWNLAVARTLWRLSEEPRASVVVASPHGDSCSATATAT